MSDPSSAAIAGLESVVVGGLFLAFGALLADAASRLMQVRLDAVHKWGLAIMSLSAYAAALMTLHIATRGSVFSSTVVTRGTTAVVAILAAVAALRRKRSPSWEIGAGRQLLVALALVVAALLIWGRPVFSNLPLHFSGDTKSHLARSSQLLNGGTTPSTTITGDVPNDYPWLFHALLALVARFTPGGRTMHALGPVMVLLLSGSVFTLFALGRELIESWVGGAAVALFGALTGGFGWLVSRGPELVAPRDVELTNHFFGDFVDRRSYNIAFHNIPPPFPRELTYVLLFAFLLLVVLGLTRNSFPPLVAAGVSAGMIGLTGGEAFIVAVGVAGVIVTWGPMHRIRLALALVLPAFLLWGGWVVPMIVNYVKLGGFADLSAPPVHIPPLSVLGSWGIVTPFAFFGAMKFVPRAKQALRARVMLVTAIVTTAALIASSIAARLLEQGLATLGRSHRYWPLVEFAVALYGAAGATLLLERLLAKSRAGASLAAASVVAVAGASPLLASVAFADRYPPDPLLAASLRGAPETLLNVMSPEPGGSCHAAVPPEFGRPVTAYTGYRLVYFAGDYRQQARIRWNEVPNLIGEEQRSSDNRLLTAGLASKQAWDSALDRYGVDIVVADAELARAPRFQSYRRVVAEGERSDLLVIWIRPECVTERVEVGATESLPGNPSATGESPS